MSSSYSKWSDIKAKGRALDCRTSEQAAARERPDACVRGTSSPRCAPQRG